MASEATTFLGFFRRLGASSDEAEDLVQEVFLKLFRHAPTYEPSGRFAAFAFRIARNAWIDQERRRAARPGLARADARGDAEEVLGRAPHTGRAPGEAAAEAEEARRVRAAIARLSERHRVVFELGVVQELPYQEIAGLLEIPEGTVKSRMFHAVRKLREQLEDPPSEHPQVDAPAGLGRRAASEGGRA